MLATVSALAAQNIGADKHDRAAKTLYTAMLITSVYGILIGLVTEVAAEYILGFFHKRCGCDRTGQSISACLYLGCISGRGSISALPVISVLTDCPILGLSTMCLRLYWCVFPGHILLRNGSRTHCSRWECQRRWGLFYLHSSVLCSLSG